MAIDISGTNRSDINPNRTYRESPSRSEQQQASDISEPSDNVRATAERVAQKSTRNTSYTSGLTPEEQRQLDEYIKDAASIAGMMDAGFNQDPGSNKEITQKIENNVLEAKKEALAKSQKFTAEDMDAVVHATIQSAIDSIDPRPGSEPTPTLTGDQLAKIRKEADQAYDAGATGGTPLTKSQFEELTIQMAVENNKNKVQTGKGSIDDNDIKQITQLVAQAAQQYTPDDHIAFLGKLFTIAVIYFPDPKS